MTQGKIIEYIDQGKFICAVCLQDKGSSLHLLTSSNREVKLSGKRAVLVSNSTYPVSKGREELLTWLRNTDMQRNLLKEKVDVKELWELVREEEEQFDKAYLAQLVYGQSVSDDHLSGLVRAFFDDRVYFKMKDGLFSPNSEEKVQQILRQREEEALRKEMIHVGGGWLKQVLEGKNPAAPPHRDRIVNLLIQLALYGNEGADAKYGKELLAKADISDVQKVREILIRLGVWEEDENLDLLRAGIETTFPQNQLDASSELACSMPDLGDREDLRNLYVFTIDGPATLDFDDAVSLEISKDGVELGIHIADVCSIIQPGSVLDQEASERGSSLYLPRREIPMIPHDLSHNTLSLLQGCDRPAVSLLARFEKSGKLAEYRFLSSVIRVNRKLTYEEADAILESEDGGGLDTPDSEGLGQKLGQMLQMARRLQLERMNQDAMRITLPELQVVFSGNSLLELKQDDQDTPSRTIIAELMILYNGLAAKYCRDNRIPALFRTQAEPSERLPDGDMDYIYYVFMQRRKLSPVRIESFAGPHSGLGLDAYIQVTSPIRRYLDLVVQRQIRSHLKGEPPVYNDKALEEIRMNLEPVVKLLQNIRRNRLRYWVLKYLGRRRGQKLRAVVLDEFRKSYRIVLRDYFLVAEINKREGRMLAPGDEVLVRIEKSDPWNDTLKLEYAE